MAPVVRALDRNPAFTRLLISTSQHDEMLRQALDTWRLQPDVDLKLMRERQTLEEVTARALLAISPVLIRHRPDIILVQGDTTTVLTAALAAYYRRIPVGHVEAGLRSFDHGQPFPEEGNRCLTTTLAAVHFAPTEGARQNLLREGQAEGDVFVTGNTVVDALRQIRLHPPFDHEPLNRRLAADRRLLLVTAHRRENHGPGLRSICAALHRLALSFEDAQIVFPVHLNPAVRQVVVEELGSVPNIVLTDPVGHADLLRLMARAHFVLTDSGGMQEEAAALGRPVLILREVTERPEVVEVGTGRLVGTDSDRIVKAATRLMTDPAQHRAMSGPRNPFGDGRAAERIVEILQRRYLGGAPDDARAEERSGRSELLHAIGAQAGS